MELFVTYNELQRLIESKSGYKLYFSKNGDGTLRVAYSLEMPVPFWGNVKKEIYINLSINRIEGNDLYITYSSAKGLDVILSGVKIFLGDIIEKKDLLSWGTDDKREVIVHVDCVAKNANMNNYDYIRDQIVAPVLSIKEEGLQLSFCLKLN